MRPSTRNNSFRLISRAQRPAICVSSDEHQQSGSDAGDVVSMLVAARDQDGDRLSRTQIRDNLLTLFVAGHETVANALAWTCCLLAQYPRVGRKLLDELQTQLHGRAPT